VSDISPDAGGEDAEHLAARGREGPEPRRVEHPGGEISSARHVASAASAGGRRTWRHTFTNARCAAARSATKMPRRARPSGTNVEVAADDDG
jgi:hypothetical protein